MVRKGIVSIVLGLILIILLTWLFLLILKAPTFMLSSVYIASMIIFALILGSLVVSGMIKLIFKKVPFFTILFFVLSITSMAGIYKLWSQPLIIVVPKGYVGQVTLVLSNVKENILTVDSNGIGYINKRTFNNMYVPPIVREADGTDVVSRCVGFNPATFWGKGSSSGISISTEPTDESANREIQYLCFEVVPIGKEGQKQYYNTDLFKFVDKSKLYDEKSNR